MSDDFPSTLRSRFHPIRRLGAGGMGQVFLAEDAALDRKVAVKLLQSPDDERACMRLEREAGRIATIQHPNVIRTFDSGHLGDTFFLVLEFIDGHSLDGLPPGVDPMGPMMQVAVALDVIHAAGLVHRDLKPANILRTPQGRAVLADFGLVFDPQARRMTKTGAILGTANYMDPANLREGTARPEQDWWAWGATLFELLEGHPPYHFRQLMETLQGSRLPPLEFGRTPRDDPRAEVIRRVLVPDADRRLTGAAAIRELLLTNPEPAAPPGAQGAAETLVIRSLRIATPTTSWDAEVLEPDRPQIGIRQPALVLRREDLGVPRTAAAPRRGSLALRLGLALFAGSLLATAAHRARDPWLALHETPVRILPLEVVHPPPVRRLPVVPYTYISPEAKAREAALQARIAAVHEARRAKAAAEQARSQALFRDAATRLRPRLVAVRPPGRHPERRGAFEDLRDRLTRIGVLEPSHAEYLALAQTLELWGYRPEATEAYLAAAHAAGRPEATSAYFHVARLLDQKATFAGSGRALFKHYKAHPGQHAELRRWARASKSANAFGHLIAKFLKGSKYDRLTDERIDEYIEQIMATWGEPGLITPTIAFKPTDEDDDEEGE